MKFMRNVSDVNTHMLLPISENLAILPYFIRSIRISKMFEAREKYCNDNSIPREQIRKWSEQRMIGFLFIFMGGMIAIELIFFSLGQEFYLFSSIDGIIEFNTGIFKESTYN